MLKKEKGGITLFGKGSCPFLSMGKFAIEEGGEGLGEREKHQIE